MLSLVVCAAMLLAGMRLNSRAPKPPPSEFFPKRAPFDEDAWMREARLLYSEWPGPPMPSEAELRKDMEKERAFHFANPTPPMRDAIRRWEETEAEAVAKSRSHGNALIGAATLLLVLQVLRVLLGN